MIPRKAAETVKRLKKGFSVLCITGPRQSGKTTLANACFPDKPYLSLDDPDIARLVNEDPRGLLALGTRDKRHHLSAQALSPEFRKAHRKKPEAIFY